MKYGKKNSDKNQADENAWEVIIKGRGGVLGGCEAKNGVINNQVIKLLKLIKTVMT